MLRKNGLTKASLSLLLVFAVLGLGPSAEAWDRGGGRGGHGGPSYGYRHYTPRYIPCGRSVYAVPRNSIRLNIGGFNLFYGEGTYYRRSVDRYVVVAPPMGTVVTTIPQGYAPVVVNGETYYNINDATYVPTSSGYRVVPEPRVVVVDGSELRASAKAAYEAEENAAKAAALYAGRPSNSRDAFSVNVPNSRGTYTAVTLRRSGTGFLGPQGEYYSEFPSVEQLGAMYGR